MKIKLYSLSQIQSALRKNKKNKINIEKFFSRGRAILLKNGRIYIPEGSIADKVDLNFMSEYDFIEADFSDLLIISNYNALIKEKKKYRQKATIEHRNNLDKESNYLNNIVDYISVSKRIASIDCEFNRNKITEIGIFVYDRLKKSFETYHFCERRVDCNAISPFKNPHVLSMSKIHYVDDINEIIDIVEGILGGIDTLCGHAVKNDLDRLSYYGLNLFAPSIIDTQKIYQKFHNEQISLGNAFSLYTGLPNFLLEDANIKNEVNLIKEKYKKTHPNFLRDNLIGTVFTHNAFNDAFLTFFVLMEMMRREKGLNFIEINQKEIYSTIKSSYLKNIKQFKDYFLKKG